MAVPHARSSWAPTVAGHRSRLTSQTQAQETADDATTPTFAEYLLERFTQFSDALEIFFENDPVASHPLGKTMVSQLRFCIHQSHRMVKAQEKLLEQLKATQEALARKDEALERVIELYVECQVASQGAVASGSRNPRSRDTPGRLEERPILAQEQSSSDQRAPEWI